MLAYAAVIALIRTTFFIADRTGLPEPGVVIGGVHLHHYLFGIGLTFLVSILAIHQKSSKSILSLLFGVSLALILDEFQYLLKLTEVTYSPSEYIPIVLVGLVLVFLTFLELQKLKKEKFTPGKLVKFPFISVVIPAFNEEGFIGKTLKSLIKQNYPGSFEMIVVDNGSSDKTAEIARKHGAKVIAEPRKGVQFARQTGFEASSGEFIASTDADNILPKNWLRRLACQLIRDNQLVAVGGWFKLKKGPITPRFILNYFSTPTLFLYTFLTGKKVLLGQNFMVRRQVFFQVGGFANLSSMNEDLELAQKLSNVGRVLLKFDKKSAVITSPRRWSQGFFKAVTPYIINALSFGLFQKLVFKSFSDIRSEKPAPLRVKPVLAFISVLVFVIVVLLAIPASPVHAKIAPRARRVEKRIFTIFHHASHATKSSKHIVKNPL